MAKLKVLIFLSSVRQERLADRISNLVQQQLNNFGFELDVIDPLIENLDIVHMPYHFYQNPNDIPENIQELKEKISAADAYVIISAEYNWSIPPGLTNIIDHFSPHVFKFKPLSIVTYSSGLGGMVVCGHIISMMSSMGCLVQPMVVNIPMAEVSVTVDGKTQNKDVMAGLKLIGEQLRFSGLAYKNQKNVDNIPNVNLFF